MGFREAAQRAIVCHTLMKLVRQEKLFLLPSDIGLDEYGPTGNAEHQFGLMQDGSCSLSAGEQTMLSLAWYFWNGYGQVRIEDIMSLEPSLVEAVGTLITASVGRSPILIDKWIEKWQDFDAAAAYFAS